VKYKAKISVKVKEKEEECPGCKEKIKIVVTGDQIEFKDKDDVKKASVKGKFYEGVTIECFKCGSLLIFKREELTK
jgi:hypothetical protein